MQLPQITHNAEEGRHQRNVMREAVRALGRLNLKKVIVSERTTETLTVQWNYPPLSSHEINRRHSRP